MKFTLSWLKEHLDTTASVAEIQRTLTMLGLEVESVEDRAAKLEGFITAHVLEAVQHPNADKLRVCKVDTGSGIVQVVCGAPNARTGMKGVFAPSGAHIPGTGLDLKPSKIRGVDSNGMLCSERELELSEDHAGIIDLPADTPIGLPAARVLGIDDPVIEIKVTPNRADALGVLGIARDLEAAGLGRRKQPDVAKVPGTYKSPVRWTHGYDVKPGVSCPIVVGRHFRNVKNGPSPAWLQQRLRAIGLRPISALVDITNLVTFDLNRPLHVFDADKIAGDLVMRQATPGETVLALDGRTYTLDETMAVIADSKAVHGIGGIMGGEDSGVSETTTNVFLEVAYFDPIAVSAAGRKLAIQSDARYRFERGVDPESVWWGAEVAARLILELCGGETSELVSSGIMPAWQRSYSLRPERARTLGGADVPAAAQLDILRKLGFGPSGEGPWSVAVPSWRPDVVGEADLVEEVVRVHGYDNVPAVSMPRETATSRPVRTPEQRRVPTARRALAVRGLTEAVTSSFTHSVLADLFGGVGDDLKVLNPIASELDVMRPSILPNLLQACGRNEARGLKDPALFEVGPQYKDATPTGQRSIAAGVRYGKGQPRAWTGPERPVDAFDAKADALAVLAAIGAPTDNLVAQPKAPAWYHPGRSGALVLGDRPLAYFGEVHPDVLAKLDLRGPAAAFEVFLDAAPPAKARPSKARPALKLSPFQPLERDFAFIVDGTIPADTLVRAARGADRAMITAAQVFDVYAGKGVPDGKKSVALSVTIQPAEKTLTDEEIEAISQKVVAQVAKQAGGVLRG
ncbi:phenylalanine--tRNA ligase subunit beta [Reyranella sp. CPCC 100927]|uniref:phenylalanine--tRNA ligase subunit beta n=1 Tax=Reyranella sp. CPCC 100927 TaxID=2599616 RepID=UPI0011B60463|nr:phenylalanine--tRNA ligase subunit beta [Reyranella sp. CPCC 100927]TWT15104.1 phenylalanine--tRNA ligase subunit beta [Reyranella sp. CPCC 100927]